MKYKCCQQSISHFMITDTTLAFCSRLDKRKNPFIEKYNGETDFVEKYKQSRLKFIENCKQNKDIPMQCQSCPLYIEADWDETFGIDLIGIANRTKCSCNCIYCVVSDGNIDNRRELNQKEIWDIRPVLETLEKNNLLKKSGKIFVAGGECSEYPIEELEWIINFAFSNNFSIELASSGMFYSEQIGKALREGAASVLISPDSGTKETYEKIKRVKYYDKVWENIRRYIEDTKDNPKAKVSVKYIILEGLNDNLDEFKAFMAKCDEVGCKSINMAVDLDWLFDNNKNKQETSKNTREIIDYIKSLKDDRIYSDVFYEIREKKTSAKEYSLEIEQALLEANTKLYIVVFSGTDETYRKLTNSDLFNQIWSNIGKYSTKVKYEEQSYSSIVLQYKLISGINDNLDEIKAFLNKCDDYSLTNIEFSLFDGKIANKNKLNVENLKTIYSYLKEQNMLSITFSQQILDLVKGR